MTTAPLAASSLKELGLRIIQELETPTGILAAGREEIYGCIFGRDSLITGLKLLRAYEQTQDRNLIGIVRNILVHLAELQGRTINIESGEQPGKCIHEFRTENHEHLTKRALKPWHVYPDGSMRNFDSVDATPLFLIASYRYFKQSGDQEFLETVLPHMRLALRWILEYGDSNGDGFIDYALCPDRICGGLAAQSWMDSHETLFHEDGEAVAYPIAPVEVQGYAYLALRLWSEHFQSEDAPYAALLSEKADNLKKLFNEKFILSEKIPFGIACALDGTGKPLTSVRSSMGHLLWACLVPGGSEKTECILEERFIPSLVGRLLAPDLFEPEAGIRTLGTRSRNYQAMSYHNGSIWPHDTSLIIEGLENFGYRKEAARVRRAITRALCYFGTPIELFVYENGTYVEYASESGQAACKKQAWCAASMLTEALTLERNAVCLPETA